MTEQRKRPFRRWRQANRGYQLAMTFFNAMGSSGVVADRSWGILESAVRDAPWPPDVVAGVECQVLPSDRISEDDWDFLHVADVADRAGLFIQVRRARGRILDARWILGTPRKLNGHTADRMRDRWILLVRFVVDEGTDRERIYTIAIFHMPPKRNWRWFWDHMAKNLKDIDADFYVSDWNKLERAVFALLKRRVDMRHIIGWASRWRIPVNGPYAYEGGRADHPFVMILAWKRKRAPK